MTLTRPTSRLLFTLLAGWVCWGVGFPAVGAVPAAKAPRPSVTRTQNVPSGLKGDPFGWRGAPKPAFAFPMLSEPDTTDVPALRGNIQVLRVTRGRSRILKLADPVSRVSIADPELADVIVLSPTDLLLNGKQRGTTSLTVWDGKGQERMMDLVVQNDPGELMEALNALAPQDNLSVRVTDDSLVVSGRVANSVALDEIKRLASAYGYRDQQFVDLTDAPSPQVSLKVRIVETGRDVVRSLKTSVGGNSGSLSVARLANPLDILRLGLAAGSTGSLAPLRALGGVNLGVLQTNNNLGGLTGQFTSGNFDAAWDFLESKGRVNTLAEPTIIVTHGRMADFLAGGEFPFVSGVNQVGSPILSFKEYGVRLKFTPWISPRLGRLSLKIEPEVSNIDRSNCITAAGGTPVCGLTKRAASTVVELANGETLVIAGILSRSDEQNFQQLPFIGDIPILGALFKNADTRRNDRELVVVVTPTVMDPPPATAFEPGGPTQTQAAAPAEEAAPTAEPPLAPTAEGTRR